MYLLSVVLRLIQMQGCLTRMAAQSQGYMPLARQWGFISTTMSGQLQCCAVRHSANLQANTRLVEDIQISRVLLLIFDRFLINKLANESIDDKSR